jgi:Arc/MetJ-type ribon-helix-helix transcriptional regulator
MPVDTNDKVNVSIPLDLHRLLSKQIEGKGFATVDDYVVYVLHLAVGKNKEELSKDDEEKVTARLRALGYI